MADHLLNTPITSMVLVMGVTGSGKSHFINTLVRGATMEYAGLRSGTQDCQLVQAKIGMDESIAIVDTPGFDDTRRTDAEILSLISTFLTAQRLERIPLKGIIYLHRIIDPKMQGGALRNFELFQRMCGEQALGNVVLLTTMWDRLVNEMDGYDRDQELRQDFWRLMEERGSFIARFDGSKDMAEAMVAMILGKEPIVLQIQQELQEQNMRLDQTSAGQLLAPVFDENIRRDDAHIRYLQARIYEAERQNDRLQKERLEQDRLNYVAQRQKDEAERQRLRAEIAQETEAKIQRLQRKAKWRGGLQTFVSVTGVVVSVVTNLLPFFGVNL